MSPTKNHVNDSTIYLLELFCVTNKNIQSIILKEQFCLVLNQYVYVVSIPGHTHPEELRQHYFCQSLQETYTHRPISEIHISPSSQSKEKRHHITIRQSKEHHQQPFRPRKRRKSSHSSTSS